MKLDGVLSATTTLAVLAAGCSSVSTYDRLKEALTKGDVQMARDHLSELDEDSVLVSAVRRSDTALVEFLLGEGADPNHTVVAYDVDGAVTAVDVVSGWEGKVPFLGIREEKDETILQLDYSAVPAEILAEARFNFRYRVKRIPGATPLHYAIERGDQEMVDLFLDHGADPALCYAGRSLRHPMDMRISPTTFYSWVESGAIVDVGPLAAREGIVNATTPPQRAQMTSALTEASEHGLRLSVREPTGSAPECE